MLLKNKPNEIEINIIKPPGAKASRGAFVG